MSEQDNVVQLFDAKNEPIEQNNKVMFDDWHVWFCSCMQVVHDNLAPVYTIVMVVRHDSWPTIAGSHTPRLAVTSSFEVGADFDDSTLMKEMGRRIASSRPWRHFKLHQEEDRCDFDLRRAGCDMQPRSLGAWEWAWRNSTTKPQEPADA